MEQIIPFVFIGLIVLFIVLGAIAAQKRKKELRAWAQANGYRYSSDSYRSVDENYPAFSCLKQGSNRYAYNMVLGKFEAKAFHAFDYHYETYSTDSKGRRQTHHHYFSAVIVDSGLPLQPLFIRPEGFFDRVTEFFGYNDIDFESTEFSKRFYVKSSDKKWAYDVLHQECMEYLLSSPEFTLEFAGTDIIAYKGSTFSVSEFEDAMKVIQGIVCRFPNYLLQEMKGIA